MKNYAWIFIVLAITYAPPIIFNGLSGETFLSPNEGIAEERNPFRLVSPAENGPVGLMLSW